jgi:ribose transport system substrate-binding protein
VASAQAYVAAHLKRPTQIAVTTPITKSIPAGKTIVYLDCPIQNCTITGQAAKQAAGILGWNMQIKPVDGTPQSFQEALRQIIAQKPDGVIMNSFTLETVAPELKQLAALHIPVATSAIPSKGADGDGIIYDIDTTAQQKPKGQLMAAWTISDSNGAANTLYVNLPDLPILTGLYQQFAAQYKQYCSSCALGVLDLPVTAIGTTSTSSIVSYLRSHPSTQYVALSVDALGVGLPAALKAAGLSNVKVIGESPIPATLQYIQSGQMGATADADLYGDAFADVDALARYFTGTPISQNTIYQQWLLTKDTLPDVSFTNDFPMVADYEQQYSKLWGKG